MTYEFLRIVSFIILYVLFLGFTLTDGFDFGVAALTPFITKNDKEKNIMFSLIKPVWEGNQVWFVTAGGGMFGMLPYLYGLVFSGYYIAIMLILLFMVLRPVSLTFYGKMKIFCQYLVEAYWPFMF